VHIPIPSTTSRNAKKQPIKKPPVLRRRIFHQITHQHP